MTALLQPYVTPAYRNAPHVVYRLFDAECVLLYVGTTTRLRTRLREHGYTKHWWPRVAFWTVEGPFDGVFAGERREAEVIHAEKPLYAMSRRQAGQKGAAGRAVSPYRFSRNRLLDLDVESVPA